MSKSSRMLSNPPSSLKFFGVAAVISASFLLFFKPTSWHVGMDIGNLGSLAQHDPLNPPHPTATVTALVPCRPQAPVTITVPYPPQATVTITVSYPPQATATVTVTAPVTGSPSPTGIPEKLWSDLRPKGLNDDSRQ